MPWCFLASHEIADWADMVRTAESSYICRPCAGTERGQRLLQDVPRTAGYRPNLHAKTGKWSRIYAAMSKPGYYKRSYEK